MSLLAEVERVEDGGAARTPGQEPRHPLDSSGSSPRTWPRLRWIVGAPGSSPDQWLVGRRWLAIAGMLLTTLVAPWVVPEVALLPLLGTFLLIAVVNVGWGVYVVGGVRQRGSTVAPQILVDMLLLAMVLWFSGGV